MTEIRNKSRIFYPGVHIEELTLSSGTITMQNPFAPAGEEDIDVQITQKAAAAVTESFAWSLSGSVITIDSDNASSAAVVRVRIEGNIGMA